jgi:hypothetical protein
VCPRWDSNPQSCSEPVLETGVFASFITGACRDLGGDRGRKPSPPPRPRPFSLGDLPSEEGWEPKTREGPSTGCTGLWRRHQYSRAGLIMSGWDSINCPLFWRDEPPTSPRYLINHAGTLPLDMGKRGGDERNRVARPPLFCQGCRHLFEPHWPSLFAQQPFHRFETSQRFPARRSRSRSRVLGGADIFAVAASQIGQGLPGSLQFRQLFARQPLPVGQGVEGCFLLPDIQVQTVYSLIQIHDPILSRKLKKYLHAAPNHKHVVCDLHGRRVSEGLLCSIGGSCAALGKCPRPRLCITTAHNDLPPGGRAPC